MRLGNRSPFAHSRAWLIGFACLAAALYLKGRSATSGFAVPLFSPGPSIDSTQVKPGIFTTDFPADLKFRQELTLLRQKGRLLPWNENLINQTIASSSEILSMPPAILWCLLFQESRLNHLEGVEGEGARGLGQFSHFSFYEINHHLERFSKNNLALMQNVLGSDIRPVRPLDGNIKNPSSYFYIPTAVVSSAAFLNNRYLQLKRILTRNNVSHDPELLWLFASMAYNKGGRSVVSFWNDSRRRGGKAQLEQLVSDQSALFASVTDVRLLTRSLRKIWPGATAARYAKELDIHMENMRSCSTSVGGFHE